MSPELASQTPMPAQDKRSASAPREQCGGSPSITDRELLEVIREFRATDWAAISLAHEELEIRLVKRRPGEPLHWGGDVPFAALQEPVAVTPGRPERAHAPVVPAATLNGQGAAGTPTVSKEDREERAPQAGQTHVVKAATVGTFWEAPAPGAEPFVKRGDFVQRGQQLAIVELMKLMTEVLAEHAGRIDEIVVKTGQTVEADAPLFRVRLDAARAD